MQREDDAAVGKILSRIGDAVAFHYPGDEGTKRGQLKDRVVVRGGDVGAVPYWDVVDLIEFPGEAEPEWIRIGYYRKPKDTLNWGSQTTITETAGVWRRVLATAGREKPWFREILEAVMADIHEFDS